MSQEIIHTAKFKEAFSRLCQESVDKIFILTDETTHRLCRPLLKQWDRLDGATDIVIPPTDVNKNIATTTTVWSALADGGASRHSLMVCLGGGMVTDLGGFAASTFKRGLRFINIPTTLLAMVDAAVGGKTGVNFNALKNEIGVFNEAAIVVIDTDFLRTLNKRNMLSGYAEMLKHALLHDEAMWAEHLKMDFNDINYAQLQKLVEQSIEVKRHIVTIDPHEKGLRKALNLGHTVGHALESFAMETGRPVLHGYAVAWGLVGELYLSAVLQHFPQDKMRQTVRFIREHYEAINFTCNDYDRLFELMKHDKKNVGGEINFTLLSDVGEIRLDNHASRELIGDMFDFLREG